MSDELAHPSWCDPDECEAADWWRHHRGVARVIEPVRRGDVEIVLRLAATACEPLDQATTTVELVLRRSDCASVEGYRLDASAARRLHAALNSMLPELVTECDRDTQLEWSSVQKSDDPNYSASMLVTAAANPD